MTTSRDLSTLRPGDLWEFGGGFYLVMDASLVQCSRCDLPLEDCTGHGSSPESEDNEAETEQ